MASVLIVGASRGIGLEWVRQARAAGDRVVATARDEEGLQRLRELGAVALKLDVMNTASASGLAWQIDGYAFDQIALVAGVFGSRTTGLQTPTEVEFNTVMQTNVLGPMRVLPQLQDALAPGAPKAPGEFVNTWSVDGFISEGSQPAEQAACPLGEEQVSSALEVALAPSAPSKGCMFAA
jgi:NAD(P)-dependent dehydrogenase (short-subunit alcohol dehydrogenase family)